MNKVLTTKEFEKKIQQLISNIKRETTIFADDTAEKQRKRKERAEKDIFYFYETYFPHYARSKEGKAHRMMEKEAEVMGRILAIAGFRGLGKTTQLAIMRPIFLSLHGKIKFNTQIAQSDTLAMERTEAIRCEFLYNKRLRHDYGDQLPLGGQEKGDFTIKEGCRFLALGYKTGIRGKLNGPHRPDYIIVDDLEDHKSFNPRIAQDKLQFVTEEAYGAMDEGKGVVIWLGNLTHQKSALNLFKKSTENKELTGRKMLIIKVDDGRFNPTWPEKFTRETLLKIYSAVGKFGFERHYRMNPVIEGLTFKDVWFKTYQPQELPRHFDTIACYCDPSLGDSKSSDYKAIITIGFAKQRYWVLDVYLRKATIFEMLIHMYRMDKKYNPISGMEDNFWQKILWDYIAPLSKKFKYLLAVRGITNKVNKQVRIESITPIFEWGWILFPEEETEDMALLKDQFLGFPSYPNDDGPDATEGAIALIKNNSDADEVDILEDRTSPRFSDLY